MSQGFSPYFHSRSKFVSGDPTCCVEVFGHPLVDVQIKNRQSWITLNEAGVVA